ncbi:hypothetical protein HD806DRAFT_535336 [Xylariaceae sp. AK1471]|nr:hypothetical protein HD806DRAFT_535336 [Xylariaceae sp. AK1471]
MDLSKSTIIADVIETPLSPNAPLPILSAVTDVEEQGATAPQVSTDQQPFRSKGFARKDDLAQYFPSIKDEDDSWRVWISKRSRALVVQFVLVVTILLANISLTAYAISRYESSNGVGLLYDQGCETVKNLDRWLHLLINLLSTGILSASNYCMQLQAAPTRAEINRAHDDGRWLDIGVPSLRNLMFISNWRRFSWALMAFSSLPIHLIYNSAVFQSIASNDYTIAVVKDSFASGSSWSLVTAENNRRGDPGWDEARVNPDKDYQMIITDIQHSVMGGAYQKMNLSACFDLYDDYFAPQANAVVFVKNQSAQVTQDNSLLMYVSVIPRSDDWPKNLWALGNGTGKFVAASLKQPVGKWFLGPPKYEVSHCLVEPPADTAKRCRLEYSPPILYTVIGLNILKAVTIFCVWVLRRWQRKDEMGDNDAGPKAPQNQVIYTLGDAIASFMREPVEKTEKRCLAPRDDFLTRRRLKNRMIKERPNLSRTAEPQGYKNDPRLWMSAASYKRWFILLSLCLLTLLITGILLGLALTSLKHRDLSTSISDLWALGFGALTQYTYLVAGLPRSDPAGLITNVLLANLPQLVLSIIYLFYNTMLSTFLVQREFSRMHLDKNRKPLRVSEPVGIQRSSYFISLPWRYGIPLYGSSALMHWLVSQSLFLARITALNPDGTLDTVNSFSTTGCSPIAVIITMVVGFVLVAAIILIGCRRYDGTMRMVSTNSLAISAACHVPDNDQVHGYQLPVRWGVVEIDDKGVGHCAFTTAPDEEMKYPVENSKYQ